MNIIHPFDECVAHSSTYIHQHWELETNSISNKYLENIYLIKGFFHGVGICVVFDALEKQVLSSNGLGMMVLCYYDYVPIRKHYQMGGLIWPQLK